MIKNVQDAMIQFLLAYKEIFDTQSYYKSNPSTVRIPEQTLIQNQTLANNLHIAYKALLQKIQELPDHNQTFNKLDSISQSKGTPSMLKTNSKIYSLKQSAIKYEKKICEQHDTAVQRYKKALSSAQYWKQLIYTFINSNMPPGSF